uniref:Uncharacterized protein n=1 Tax=Kwoniella pini CBS 10737 TaxID=1296096 RepID=A0A1B9I763_9TREE|nr:uncharacterized protein I206_02053 [Kwoniella pini CBS 10737]OCF51339.1 hypothetical protein I206_02053 [Kwoniella pini CBS 10737]
MSDTGSIMIAPSYTPHIPLEIQEQIFQYIAQSGVKCVRTLVLLNRAAHETFQPILHKHVILKASTTGTLFKYAIPTPPLVKSKEEVDLYTRQHNRLLRVLQSIRYLRVEDMKSLERIVNICIVLGNHKPTQLWKGAKGMITGSSILADMLREIKEYKHSSWQWPTCDDPRFGPIVRKVWNFFRYFKMADTVIEIAFESETISAHLKIAPQTQTEDAEAKKSFVKVSTCEIAHHKIYSPNGNRHTIAEGL